MTTPSGAHAVQTVVELLRERARAQQALREDPVNVEHWQHKLSQAKQAQWEQARDIVGALERVHGTSGILRMFDSDELVLALHAEIIGDEDYSEFTAEMALHDIADYVYQDSEFVVLPEVALTNLGEFVQRALMQKDVESMKVVLTQLADKIDTMVQQ